MTNYTFIKYVYPEIIEMDIQKQKLFILTITKSFISDYYTFSTKEAWGNKEDINNLFILIEKKVIEKEDIELQKCLHILDNNTPDMEDIGGLLCNVVIDICAFLDDLLQNKNIFFDRLEKTIATVWLDILDSYTLFLLGYEDGRQYTESEYDLVIQELITKEIIFIDNIIIFINTQIIEVGIVDLSLSQVEIPYSRQIFSSAYKNL
jgi:hypothetical protein